MTKIQGIIIFTLSIPFLIFWWAFVLLKLWFWFITPIFGVPVPSIWMVMGITLIIRFIVFGNDNKSDNILLAVMELHNPVERKKLEAAISKAKITSAISVAVFGPLFALGAGAIYHAFS